MPHRGRGRGGPRTPDTPSQFSGEGAASSRTDGQPSGDNAPKPPEAPATRHGGGELSGVAGGQGGPGSPGSASGSMGGGGAPRVQDPFSQPTNRPHEDPTTPLPQQQPGPDPGDLMSQIDMATVAPALPVLEALSQQPGSSATLRNVVRRLRSQVPADFEPSDMFTNVQSVIADDPEAATRVATPRGEGSPNG